MTFHLPVPMSRSRGRTVYALIGLKPRVQQRLLLAGIISAAWLLIVLQVNAGVQVAQNLGANWVGSPTIMVADNPSVNLASAESNWGGGPPYSLGQSFTAPVSGQLTNIQLYVTGKNTTNALYLFDMGVAMQYAAGPPATIIPGTNSVSPNLLSSNLTIFVPNTANPSVMQLTFSGADAVNLIGGRQYYFLMVSLNSGGQMFWHRSGGGSDVYSGGTAYRQNGLLNGSKTTDFSLAVSLVNTSAPPPVYHFEINWTNLHQRIDGFGACSAWRSSWTPGFADMFFSTNSGSVPSVDGTTNIPFTGIGLSLLRSRIVPGGTTWENSIMQMAQARGARVWSTPWSPDVQFKSINNVNGGNFVSAHNEAYARQLAGYVRNMKVQFGVDIYALSVQNEPNLATSYESCVWTAEQLRDFVPYLRNALNATNMGATKIMLAEEMHWKTNLYATALADPIVGPQVDIIAAHNYDNSPPSGTPLPLPKYANPNAALWQTETSKLMGDGPFDAGMGDALYWAGRIHLFMTVAEVNAWHYWWLISYNADNEGLTDINGNPALRMYVLGQYSRFIRPGWYRINDGNNNPYAVMASAYKDPVGGGFAIVLANTNNFATNQSFRLNNFNAASVTPWITASNLTLAAQSSVPVTNNVFTYNMPARSVVTFVGQSGAAQAVAPTLLPVASQTVTAGATLVVTNTAVDPNVPPLSLTFSLLAAPTNASLSTLDATRSLLTWSPLPHQANTTNTIIVRVENNGVPPLSATNSFTVVVSAPTGVVPTTTTISAATNNAPYGTAVIFTTTVSPAPTNGEPIYFRVGGNTLGSGSLADGVAQFITSPTQLSVGGSPHPVFAAYEGDGYYQNSSSSPLAQTVLPAAVTVASGLNINSKTYDGTMSAVIVSNNVVLGGVLGSDAGQVRLSTNGVTVAFASASAGTAKPVSVQGLSLAGAAAGNYSLVVPALMADILPKPITLTPGSGSLRITNFFSASRDQFVVYNGHNGFNPALNGNLYTNFQCEVRFAPGSATQTNDQGVQIYGRLRFGMRTADYNQVYFGGFLNGIDVPVTNSGWTPISLPVDVASQPDLATIRNLLIHIYGPFYPQALSGSSVLWVDNLRFVGPGGTLIVDQFNPAGTGGNSYSGGQIGNVWANWFGAAWVNNSWDVSQDAIGVSANDKVYDGTTTATVRLYHHQINVALSGVLPADVPNVRLSTNGAASFASTAVGGNIVVTVTQLNLAGSAGGNYIAAPFNLTGQITKAPLTVIADNKTKTRGLPNPTLTATYNGLVAGDDTNALTTLASLVTTATTGSLVGDYPITASGGTAANYQIIDHTPGTLTVVTPPELTSGAADSAGYALSFPTVPGQLYQMEFKTNLTDAVWITLGEPLPGTGANVSVTNDTAAAASFFRLKIWQP
jgi:glucuronoarabinoxylan endo-1,4-beta-xylanase